MLLSWTTVVEAAPVLDFKPMRRFQLLANRETQGRMVWPWKAWLIHKVLSYLNNISVRVRHSGSVEASSLLKTRSDGHEGRQDGMFVLVFAITQVK